MVKEEGAGGGVVELAPVVALNLLDSTAKLGRHIRKKVGQSGKRQTLGEVETSIKSESNHQE